MRETCVYLYPHLLPDNTTLQEVDIQQRNHTLNLSSEKFIAIKKYKAGGKKKSSPWRNHSNLCNISKWPVWQRLQCPHWRSLMSRHRRLLRRAPSEYTSPTRTSQKPVRAVGIKGGCKKGNTAWVQAAQQLHNAHYKKSSGKIRNLACTNLFTANGKYSTGYCFYALLSSGVFLRTALLKQIAVL